MTVRYYCRRGVWDYANELKERKTAINVFREEWIGKYIKKREDWRWDKRDKQKRNQIHSKRGYKDTRQKK